MGAVAIDELRTKVNVLKKIDSSTPVAKTASTTFLNWFNNEWKPAAQTSKKSVLESLIANDGPLNKFMSTNPKAGGNQLKIQKPDGQKWKIIDTSSSEAKEEGGGISGVKPRMRLQNRSPRRSSTRRRAAAQPRRRGMVAICQPCGKIQRDYEQCWRKRKRRRRIERKHGPPPRKKKVVDAQGADVNIRPKREKEDVEKNHVEENHVEGNHVDEDIVIYI